MDPATWREMVDRTRELEYSLGNGEKIIEENEKESAVVQRRSVTASQDLQAGTVITAEHLAMLRPCPEGAVIPSDWKTIVGKKLNRSLKKGEPFLYETLV